MKNQKKVSITEIKNYRPCAQSIRTHNNKSQNVHDYTEKCENFFIFYTGNRRVCALTRAEYEEKYSFDSVTRKLLFLCPPGLPRPPRPQQRGARPAQDSQLEQRFAKNCFAPKEKRSKFLPHLHHPPAAPFVLIPTSGGYRVRRARVYPGCCVFFCRGVYKFLVLNWDKVLVTVI